MSYALKPEKRLLAVRGEVNNYTSSVSLVVVNFNAGALLTDCIASAIVQVREVIVVDNVSIDNSVTQLTTEMKKTEGGVQKRRL